MPATRVPRAHAPIRYTASPTVESERTGVYRAIKVIERRTQQLLAQGRYGQAIRLLLPLTALIDAAPIQSADEAALDALRLADAEDDVEQAHYRHDPSRRRKLIARLHRTVQLSTSLIRALEARED